MLFLKFKKVIPKQVAFTFRQLIIITLVLGFICSLLPSMKLYKGIIERKGSEFQIQSYIHELKSYTSNERIGYIYKVNNSDFPKQYYQLQHALIPTLLVTHELPTTIFAGFNEKEIKNLYADRVIIKAINPQLLLTIKQP